jgi:uncharacterized protein
LPGSDGILLLVVELRIVDVRVHESTRSPYVELRPVGDADRLLPIFIGLPEAAAIKRALEERLLPRPLTHELLASIIPTFGARLDQVVITEFADQIFLAEMHFSLGERREIVPCRPSDAIAVAIRLGSPVFANDDVMTECSVNENDVTDETGETSDDPDELVEEFNRFLDTLNPEDFGNSSP